MTSRQIIACANRGAKLLDRIQPDWFKRINLRELNLDSGKYCIIGQLNDGYFAPESFIEDATRDRLRERVEAQLKAAAKKITIPGFKACEIGFDLDTCLDRAVAAAGLKDFDEYTHGFNLDEDSDGYGNRSFSILTEAWVELIRARRQKAKTRTKK